MSDLNSRQQQLRQLMQEKARSKKTDSRIESPLAKYDEQNNLWCIVCNQKINSELIWETHLIGKSHKTRLQDLKTKKKELSTKILKRNGNISNVKETKISIKPMNNLPSNFFDDDADVDMDSNETSSDQNGKQKLPKGFFDDPEKDAKIRKAHEETLDAQLELFRKEIAEESIISENIFEEEIEKAEKEKMIAEIDEQIENWAKVDQIQKKIEKIHQYRHPKMDSSKVDNTQKSEKNIDGAGVNKMSDKIENKDEDEDEDDDKIDLNEFNFWRNKDIFFGKDIIVELKNDLAIAGTLHAVDQYLNFKLTDITVLDSQKYPYMISVNNCFIRGSVVRYVQLPSDEVDVTLLQDATRKEAAAK
ncbi:U6 snRNA-associated Sm-like protein LSm2 [Sarcoptes scabiei]|uniref:Zinc finger protein 830 n=1 Tax=Sarcoptes scabiei TaxID=52283 RepID=A0A834VF59_SARSC|nr:U6 snRNA-associated Sm-like protein LSm2 [Sarcoptes scabiei]